MAKKRASTFQAFAPDGSGFILRKRSVYIHTDTAFIGAFRYNGVWHASGVRESPQDWDNHIFLPATKVT